MLPSSVHSIPVTSNAFPPSHPTSSDPIAALAQSALGQQVSVAGLCSSEPTVITDKKRAEVLVDLLQKQQKDLLMPSDVLVMRPIVFNIADCDEFFKEFCAIESVSDKILESLLGFVASFGHQGMVKMILESKRVSSDGLGRALINSGIHSLKIVQAFIGQGTITPQHRAEAVKVAAERGCLDCVQFLASDPIIFQDARGQAAREQAICAAATLNRLDIVKALFPHETDTISLLNLSEAVQICIKENHFGVFEFLLTKGDVADKEGLARIYRIAIENAVDYDRVDMLRNLLKGQLISQEDLDNLVITAVRLGRSEVMIETLLQKGSISEKSLDKALETATRGNYLPYLGPLLLKAKIDKGEQLSQTQLEKLVLIAAPRGLIKSLTYLLSLGAISEGVKQRAQNKLSHFLPFSHHGKVIDVLNTATISK